jgi:hypothetical protein
VTSDPNRNSGMGTIGREGREGGGGGGRESEEWWEGDMRVRMGWKTRL